MLEVFGNPRYAFASTRTFTQANCVRVLLRVDDVISNFVHYAGKIQESIQG